MGPGHYFPDPTEGETTGKAERSTAKENVCSLQGLCRAGIWGPAPTKCKKGLLLRELPCQLVLGAN